MKRRDFGKALAAFSAFFLPNASKGYYERKGANKVVRGVIEKLEPTILGVDLADEGTKDHTAIHSTRNVSIIYDDGHSMLVLPITRMTYTTHPAIDMMQKLCTSISIEVVGCHNDHCILMGLFQELYETREDMPMFIIEDQREGVEVSCTGFITSLGIDVVAGRGPINFEIETVEATVIE